MLFKMNVDADSFASPDKLSEALSDETKKILRSIHELQKSVLSGEEEVDGPAVEAMMKLDLSNVEISVVTGDNGYYLEVK